LARLFLSETGVSFGQWRQQLDVALAVQMPCSGEPVQRVADRRGYDTPSAFIAMFRRVMARTPARYAQEVSAIPTGRPVPPLAGPGGTEPRRTCSPRLIDALPRPPG